MVDKKVENFMQCLLGKVIESFCASTQQNVDIKLKWIKEHLLVPLDFIDEMLDFVKPFTDKLIEDVSRLPVMLYASDDFFKRFTNSVCLKLIQGEDDQTAFLKVTAFFLILTTSVFLFDCYRVIYELPSLYYRMLKDHLSTRFYNKNKFEDMALKSRELRGNQEWISQTLGQMRKFMEEARMVELPATRIGDCLFLKTIHRLSLSDIRPFDVGLLAERQQLYKKSGRCPFCDLNCSLAFGAFFLPRA